MFHLILAFGVDPASLAVIALVSSLAGGAVSAAGAIQQGQNAKKADQYQAAVADANANNEITKEQMASQESDREADQIRLERSRNLGSQVAAAAKAGLTISGSVDDTMSDSAIGAEKDIEMAKYRGQIQGFDEQTQGLNFLDSAKAYRAASGTAVRSSYVSAFGSILGAAGSAASGYGSFKGASSAPHK